MLKKTIHTTLLMTLVSVLLMTMLSGCGARKAAAATTASVSPDEPISAAEAAETSEAGDSREEGLSDEEALSAVRNYCYLCNPDLGEIVSAGDYPVCWELLPGTDAEAVVLFNSYTGAQVRYYIDRDTGETRVTEFVPGITAEETQTDESFNARNYLPAILGTWQTASMAYEADGTMLPEYHVQFTDTEILYGHMKDGEFVLDHADRITSLERSVAGGFKVQAVSSTDVQYTYQSCEDDADILEYYETWDEAAFPDTYSGGASLSRCG